MCLKFCPPGPFAVETWVVRQRCSAANHDGVVLVPEIMCHGFCFRMRDGCSQALTLGDA